MALRAESYTEEHEKAWKRCNMLADACDDAYEETGDKRLLEASDALRAIGKIDLSWANDKYPMPWVINEGSQTPVDFPIRCRDEHGKAVLVRHMTPPDNDTCKAIADCVNTIRAIQQGIVEPATEIS